MKSLIYKYWFLLALISLLLAGYFTAEPLAWLSEIEWLKWLIVFVTLFLMALPLSFEQLKTNVTRPGPALLATSLNLGFIPLLAWPLAQFAGSELGPGILIAAATPSTLASAAVLTRRAWGNDAIPIMVTILTNATCFLVLPAWILVQTGDQLDASTLTGTIVKLFVFVVLPMGLGQLARLHRSLGVWSTKNKSRLSTLALLGILSIVFLGAIKLGARFSEVDANSPLSIGSLVITLVIVTGIHLATFFAGISLAKLIGLEHRDQVAVGFSGSQKTLMVGLSTAINLGFSMIPIVMFHTVQLIADAYLAERLRDQVSPPEDS